MIGSRSIVHDGWKATTDHIGDQLTVERDAVPGSHEFATDHWALFRLDDDFAEAHDLADAEPERVAALEQLWWNEAGRNQVLPLEDSMIGRAVAMEPGPNLPRHRRVFRPGAGPVAEDFLPGLGGGFRLTARVVLAGDGDGSPARGIVCALGDWSGGWAWWLDGGRPVATFCLLGTPHRIIGHGDPLGAGPHSLGLDYERRPTGGGTITLRVGEDVAGTGDIPEDLPFRWQIGGAGLRIGHDAGLPVDDGYRPPFALTGTVELVEFAIPALAPRQPRAEAEIARALHHE
jgi:arylsulfatase